MGPSRIVTRRGCAELGITRSKVRAHLAARRWQMVFPGVYATHNGEVSWRERLLAAVSACGAGAVASGECALNLWSLTDREPPVLTLAIPQARRCTARLPGVRVTRRRRLTRARRFGIPVVGAHQAVLDAAADTARDLDDVMSLLTAALRKKKTTVEQLRAELQHHPRHPRRTLLDEVLRAASDGLESGAELRYRRDVEGAHGLPVMSSQVEVRDRHGAVVRRRDFEDRERGIVVEVDGEIFHRDRAQQDRRRDRAELRDGRVTVRVGYVDVVDSPCLVAADVAAVQISRGWQGSLRRCGPGCLATR